MSYDPAIHHRKSIRLKGHDYAGGGIYFVTICAHREAIAAMGGKPFSGALRALIEERLLITEEKFPDVHQAIWRKQHSACKSNRLIGPYRVASLLEYLVQNRGAAQPLLPSHTIRRE